MKTVDVSVIVPCQNAARFVLECLESVANQTRPCREVIVADDASTDGSPSLIRARFPGIPVLEGPFGGASATRNAALSRARGTWVAFVDADDLWDPTHLERAFDLLEQSGDQAYLAHFDMLDDDGRRSSLKTLAELRTARTNLGLDDFLQLFARGLPNASASYVVWRAATTEIAGFDPCQLRANDLDFWLRLVSRHRWCYDPHPAVCYRLRSSGNLSQDVASRSFFRLRAFLQLRKTVSIVTPPLQKLINYWSRQAVRTAATRGSPDDWRRAEGLATLEIPASYRLFWRTVARVRHLAA